VGWARSAASRIWAQRSGPVALRVGLGGVVVAAVVVAQLSSTSAADPAAFVPGTAMATAQAIQVAPTTGSLSYAVILGTSQAAYENGEGQALSQTLDLGAIGTALEADNCQTGTPTVNPSQLPGPIQAESTNGNQSLNSTAATSLNGTGAGVGDETASATTQPQGSATTTIASDNLAGLVNVAGATASAQSNVQGGATRDAAATADIGTLSLAGGTVVLDGLHWAATQTSGASSSATATFAIGGLTVAGVSVPITNDSISTVLSIVNTALSPTGLEIEWPVQSTLSDGTVQISPLIVGIDSSALGQEIVGANLATAEPVRNVLQQELLAVNCNTAEGLLVGDIGLGVLGGGGNLNIELGGASAVTTDEAFVSPFGSTGAGIGGTGSVLDTSTLPSSDDGSSGFGLAGATGTGTGATTAPSTTAPSGSGSGTPLATGPLMRSVSCRSTGTAGGGCNGSDLAAPVGLAGLALLGGLATWDYTRQRRRARLVRRGAS
jgi:hypothetical protein